MKLPLLLALIPCAVFAQNFQSMPRLKPILPRLNQPWTKMQPMGNLAVVGPAYAPPGTPLPRACSIPLLVVRPRENDRQMIVTPPANVESRMPQVTPPAPPCADLQGR